MILVGERAAGPSGTLSAVLRLAERTGARLAWVPRRAGDRGAVEAGCLPNLLPGGRPVADAAARVDTQTTWGIGLAAGAEGRDADEMLVSAADDELAALVVAGVDPSDFADPPAALEGLEAVGFVVSLETRASLVTERADVVLPVSLIARALRHASSTGRAGDRPFGAVIKRPTPCPTCGCWPRWPTVWAPTWASGPPAQARAELDELGAWDGARAAAPDYRGRRADGRRPDRPRCVLGHLAAGARRQPRARRRAVPAGHRPRRRSPGSARRTARPRASPELVTVANDRGALTLPVVVEPAMVDGVVWLPTKAPGNAVVAEHLAASAGDLVTISARRAPMAPTTAAQEAAATDDPARPRRRSSTTAGGWC